MTINPGIFHHCGLRPCVAYFGMSYKTLRRKLFPLWFRYEQLAEQEERSYQQLRRKLYSELQQERDRLAAEMHGQRDLLERQMKELKVNMMGIQYTFMACL